MKRIVKLKEKFILTEADPINDLAGKIQDTAARGIAGSTEDKPSNSSSKNNLDLMADRQEANWNEWYHKTWPQFFKKKPDGSYADPEGVGKTIKDLGKAVQIECMNKGMTRADNPFILFIDEVIVKKGTKLTAAQYGAVHNAYVDHFITDANLLKKAYADMSIYKGHDVLWATGLFNFTAETIYNFLSIQSKAVERCSNKMKGAKNADDIEAIEKDLLRVCYREDSGTILRSIAQAQQALAKLFPNSNTNNGGNDEADSVTSKVALPAGVATAISTLNSATAKEVLAVLSMQSSLGLTAKAINANSKVKKKGYTVPDTVSSALNTKYTGLISKLTKETAKATVDAVAEKL